MVVAVAVGNAAVMWVIVNAVVIVVLVVVVSVVVVVGIAVVMGSSWALSW